MKGERAADYTGNRDERQLDYHAGPERWTGTGITQDPSCRPRRQRRLDPVTVVFREPVGKLLAAETVILRAVCLDLDRSHE